MKLVLKGVWAIPVIASILILGSLGLSQDAFAVGGTISDQASCVALGGTWISSINLCSINDLTINSGETLVVSSGIILIIFGTSSNSGTIDNFGTTEIQGDFFNVGTINNFGILRTILGTNFLNFGTIILIDSGLITGEGGINNDFGTIIGTSCGSGTTRSVSTNECEADVTQAQLDAALDERDAALDKLLNLFTNNSCDPLAGTIPEVFVCITDLIANLAGALITITGLEEEVEELEELIEELGQPGPPVANQGNGQGVPAQGKNKP